MNNYGHLSSHSIICISYIIIFVLAITIADKRFKKSNKFEYVWFCSKIKTIKKIVEITSFNYKVFNTISSGKIIGLSSNYYDLLKLNTENGCLDNHKECGILDTLGNKLCIDSSYPCPLNDLIADYSSRENTYLYYGYNTGEIESLTYNYKLYYSNKYTYENCTIMLVKSIYKPKFIDYDNFNLDNDAYKEVFRKSIFENDDENDDDDDNDNDDNNNNLIIQRKLEKDNNILSEKIIEVAIDVFGKIIGNFMKELISYAKEKHINKFIDYVIEKIDDDNNNIDIYYRYIGDHYYAKNFIGFQNIKHIENFLKINFDLYKKTYPDYACSIIAIFSIFVSFALIIFSIYTIYNICKANDDENNQRRIDIRCSQFCLRNLNLFQIVFSVIFCFISFGFFTYFFIIYLKIANNKTLKNAKSIKSDKFINDFLEEFISKVNNTGFIEYVFIFCSVSIILHFIGLIIYFTTRRN